MGMAGRESEGRKSKVWSGAQPNRITPLTLLHDPTTGLENP